MKLHFPDYINYLLAVLLMLGIIWAFTYIGNDNIPRYAR